MIIIKLICIYLLIIILIIIAIKCTENFNIFDINKYDNHNIDQEYCIINKEFIPKYYISSFPSNDIDYINDKSYFYEYNDKDYEKYMSRLLQINDTKHFIMAIEGINWSKWNNPDDISNKYYNKFIEYFNNIIEPEKIKVIYNVLKKYKYYKNNYLLDVDLLLYKLEKLNGKHINIILTYNNNKFEIVSLKVIGSVNEYDIHNNTYLKNINNDLYIDYNKSYNIANCDDCIFSITDKCFNNNIKNILLNNLNKNYLHNNENKRFNENIEYTNNQNDIRKSFIDNLKN